jgi:hypothetical protein
MSLPAETQLVTFFARQRLLLAKERDAEIERSSLLLSKCSPKLLEEKGLSLGALGIASVNIGLGGKTCVQQILVVSALNCSDIAQLQPSGIRTTIGLPHHYRLSSTYIQVC